MNAVNVVWIMNVVNVDFYEILLILALINVINTDFVPPKWLMVILDNKKTLTRPFDRKCE